MYSLISTLFGYTGSAAAADEIIIAVSGAVTIMFFAVSVDLIYKFFLRFIPKDSK